MRRSTRRRPLRRRADQKSGLSRAATAGSPATRTGRGTRGRSAGHVIHAARPTRHASARTGVRGAERLPPLRRPITLFVQLIDRRVDILFPLSEVRPQRDVSDDRRVTMHAQMLPRPRKDRKR